MSNNHVDLFFDQGADWSDYIILLNPDQTPINVAGYTFTSAFKTSYYTPVVTANLITTIVDSANGNVEISLDSANTANIGAGVYVYDVFQVDTNNKKSRIQNGLLTISPSVTGIIPTQNAAPVFTGIEDGAAAASSNNLPEIGNSGIF